MNGYTLDGGQLLLLTLINRIGIIFFTFHEISTDSHI